MKQFSSLFYDGHLQLNMFRAFPRPSSGAQWLQWQPLVLPSYRGDSRAVFMVGPAGPTTNTVRLSPRYESKTRGCRCSHWAPDDRRGNARNMFSCKQTSRIINRKTVASGWWFIWIARWCTDLQTLNLRVKLSAHTVFMFCIYLRINSDFCPIYNKLTGFMTEMKSIYSAERTGSLNKAVSASSVNG